MQSSVPQTRIRAANDRPLDPHGRWVLYWMIAARRTRFSFALERAAEWARHLNRPLVVLEALRCDYPWASDRLHRFVLDGMAANRRALEGRTVTYHPYVENERGAGSGLLETLAADAAVVVTDHYPTFFLPRMVAAAASRLDVRLEAVDGNGLLPLSVQGSAHATAHSLRRTLQRTLLDHLDEVPLEDPLAEDLPGRAELPPEIADRWPAAAPELLAGAPGALADLPLDHAVRPTATRGGPGAAAAALHAFIEDGLDRYASGRNRPDDDASSHLSPYLHFGHVSAHEVFLEVVRRERWSQDDVRGPADGRRAGWWGMSESAEAFLDQLVTWRELGYGFCHHRADHASWESLPDWAQQTLTEHAADPREHLYSLEELEGAATHDELWNAAQRQLLREGRIHTYLRMLWGKKILEWTSEPREALEVMIELNDRYALDGRDPNSYSGILWVLGRHDRAWGPERPVFGKVRYMTSSNTARKVPVREYLRRYGES